MKVCFNFILFFIFTLSAYGKDPHLMLYFDMNKTLIASDEIQNISAEDTLNQLLAKKWTASWDSSIKTPISYSDYVKKILPVDPKGDPNTIVDIETKRKTHLYRFINYLNETNHPLYPEVSKTYEFALEKLKNSPHCVFPSFYRLIDKLDEEQKSYTIILRSFGSEVFKIAEKINTAVPALFQHIGMFKKDALSIDNNEQESNLSEIYNLLHSLSHIAIRDDYAYWEEHGFQGTFGKPFLLDQSNPDLLEIFFDDAIALNNQEANIIAPIDVRTGQHLSIQDLARSGQVVKVNTLEAILNDNYFIGYIEQALSLKSQKTSYYVGELGETWQFPSDHLPVGASIDNLHMICWNILNKDYLKYIELNTQGLKNSSILPNNIPLNQNSSLTVREKIIEDQIIEMINHPTHPRSLIALQEAHEDIINSLKTTLPPSWITLIPSSHPDAEDVFLYDSNIFEFINLDVINHTSQTSNLISTLTLKEKKSGKTYRFIQSHIPGGSNSPVGCADFAKEALKQFDENMTIILMGDMNQLPFVIERALQKVATDENRTQPYRHLSIESPTHVNTQWEATWIDNLFFFTPEDSSQIKVSAKEDFFSDLVPIIELLNFFK